MPYCSHCSMDAAELDTCSGCGWVHYCNVECQRADWSHHRAICSIAGRKKHYKSNGSRMNHHLRMQLLMSEHVGT